MMMTPSPPTAAAPARTRWLVFSLLFLALVSSYAIRGLLAVAVIDIDAEFSYTAADAGTINAAFFSGYMLLQFPGGALATRLGGHPVMLVGILLPSLLTLLTPAMAGSLPTLVVMRFLTGFFEGVAYPTVHALVAQWSPQAERSSAVGWIWSGAYIGTGVTLPLAGLLASRLGWRSIFYVFGAAGLAWSAAWVLLASSSPERHRFIDPAERAHILATRKHRGSGAAGSGSPSSSSLAAVPWRRLLLHPAVLAVIVAHTAHNFLFYLLLTWLPTYLHSVLGFSLEDAAASALFPFGACFVGSLVSGRIADGLIGRGVPVARVRKGMQVVSEALPAAALAAAGHFTSGPAVVGLLTVAVGLSGFCSAGYAPNHIDIAPQYAGLLMGVGNTVASLPGVVAPLLVGALLQDGRDGDAGQWRKAFYTASAVALAGCAFFARFARGDVLAEFADSVVDGAGDAPEEEEEEETVALTGAQSGRPAEEDGGRAVPSFAVGVGDKNDVDEEGGGIGEGRAAEGDEEGGSGAANA